MTLLSFAIIGETRLLTMGRPLEEGWFVSGVVMAKGRTPGLGLTSLTGKFLLGGNPLIRRGITSLRPPNL